MPDSSGTVLDDFGVDVAEGDEDDDDGVLEAVEVGVEEGELELEAE